MNILTKLKQINIFNIITILVITLLLSLTNNYLSKKPMDLIYKPKPVIEDNLLFGDLSNSNVNKVNEVSEVSSITEVDKSNSTQNKNSDLTKSENNNSVKVDDLNKENKNKLANEVNNLENSNSLKSSKNEVDKSVKENTLDNLEKVVNYNQVLKIIGNNNFVIIDARSKDDFQKGKIANAINIFPYNENESEYFQQIMSLPRDKRFLIYCTGGNCDLSHHLAEDMANFGFTNMFIYVGGWEEWEKKSTKK